MRASKWWAGALAVFLLGTTLTGCTSLRTPYEMEKIKEAGGVEKAKEGGGGGGGEKKEGGGGGGGEDKKKSGEGPAAVAGAPKDDKGKKEEGADEEKAETKGDKGKQKEKAGALYTIPRHMEDKNPRLLYNQALSSEVSMVQGVGNATVLLDEEHNAYVALAAPDAKPADKDKEENEDLQVQTEGDISDKVQKNIAKTLRKSDPMVGNVYLTNDPSHVENFNRYAARALKGDVNDLQSKALAEHIQDIWK